MTKKNKVVGEVRQLVQVTGIKSIKSQDFRGKPRSNIEDKETTSRDKSKQSSQKYQQMTS